MKKSGGFSSIIGIYLVAILCSFLINQLFFRDIYASSNQMLLDAIARFSLVALDQSGYQMSTTFMVYSLICTQLAGTLWLTALLWCYWKIFDRINGKDLKDALLLTLKVSMIVEGFLFIFFLYAVSGIDTTLLLQQKIIAALSLSINSFHNAGITHLDVLLSKEELQLNTVIQIGIVAGTLFGQLGIFVIDELFSPVKLRYRLAYPQTDWSFITKVAVFGAAAVLGIFSLLFFFWEQQVALASRNLMEGLIASIAEVSSYRGFGYQFVENTSIGSKSILFIANLFGSGPFTTGGGFTLLIFPGLIYLLSSKNKDKDLRRSYLLSKNLVIYTIASFTIVAIATYFVQDNHEAYDMIYRQWLMFSSNRFLWNEAAITNLHSIIDIITIMLGRISLVFACFLTLRKN